MARSYNTKPGQYPGAPQPAPIQTPGIGGGAGTGQQVGMQHRPPGAGTGSLTPGQSQQPAPAQGPIGPSMVNGQYQAPTGGWTPQSGAVGGGYAMPRTGGPNYGAQMKQRMAQQQQQQQPVGRPPKGTMGPGAGGAPMGNYGPGSYGPPPQQLPNQYAYQPQQGQSAGFGQQMANAQQQQRLGSYNSGSNQQMPAPAQQGFARPMQAQASIQPQNVYGNQFMQQSQNMARAQGVPAMSDLRNQMGRPGLSLGSNAAQAGLGQAYGQSVMGGANNAASLAQGMGFANATNQLQGQQARDQEAQQWGQLGAQGRQNQWNNQNAQQQNLLGFLQSGYRGL